MATIVADVLRIADVEANVIASMRERQIAIATDTGRLVAKMPGGDLKYYSDDSIPMGITVADTTSVNLDYTDGILRAYVLPEGIRHAQLDDLDVVADHPGYLTRAGDRTLTAAWDAGSYPITSTSVAFPTVITDQLNPTGFTNGKTDSTLALDTGTRVFTLAPTGATFSYYYRGIKYASAAKTVTIPDVTALYFVYIVANGTLTASTTSWDLDACDAVPVALVYWNATLASGFVMEERHSSARNARYHSWAHSTFGTRYKSGGAASFTNTTFSVDPYDIRDEDISNATSGATTTIRCFYRTGTRWDFTATQTTPYIMNGANLRYDNAGTITDVGVNRYVAMWIFATNSIASPLWCVIGQREDTTLADARANNTYESLSLGTLPTAEFKIMYRVLFRNTGATPTYTETADYRSVSNAPGGTYVATLHSALTGLTADDHTQYALLAGRVGGQTLVGDSAGGTGTALTLRGGSTTTGSIVLEPGSVSGNVTISNLAHANTAPTGFVGSWSGVLAYRTPAETLADIGAAASSHTHAAYLNKDGTVALTGAWSAGQNITAPNLIATTDSSAATFTASTSVRGTTANGWLDLLGDSGVAAAGGLRVFDSGQVAIGSATAASGAKMYTYSAPTTGTAYNYNGTMALGVGTTTVTQGIGQYNEIRLVVNDGIRNEGATTGLTNFVARSGAGDKGSYNQIEGLNCQVGHWYCDSAALTTSASGASIYPYCSHGTISAFYGLVIKTITGAGTISEGWGIYSAPTTFFNYFGGKVGIGEQRPTVDFVCNGDAHFPDDKQLRFGNTATSPDCYIEHDTAATPDELIINNGTSGENIRLKTNAGSVIVEASDIYSSALASYSPTLAVSGGTGPQYATVACYKKSLGKSATLWIELHGISGNAGSGTNPIQLPVPSGWDVSSSLTAQANVVGSGHIVNGSTWTPVNVVATAATYVSLKNPATGSYIVGNDQNNTSSRQISVKIHYDMA